MKTAALWPKTIPPLTPDQKRISDDFMHYWHEVLPARYGVVEDFNHRYPVLNAPAKFLTTLEIGAGLGEHLRYEQLNAEQESNYVALELRENMAEKIKERFPKVQTCVGDCQQTLDFPSGFFDRILAIHVLEHLPDLPAAIREMYRLCKPDSGIFSVVIPCEGGWAYSLARKISARRIFERRYKQSYDWFIEREHINLPHEILGELQKVFTLEQKSFFPLRVPAIWCNLCIGLTLRPRPASRGPSLH
jgi:SAM-dependent methyltransferase